MYLWLDYLDIHVSLRDHCCPPGGGRTHIYPTYRGHIYILADALSRYVYWCSILARCHICMHQMYGSYDNKAVNRNSVHVSRCVPQTQQSAHILSDSLSSFPELISIHVALTFRFCKDLQKNF